MVLRASYMLLYGNYTLSKEMGLFGRKLAETEFTIEKTVNETVKVYESLLKLN